MAKKKVKKAAPKTTPKKATSKNLFDLHPNLKWLLPLFFILAVGFLLAFKHRISDEDKGRDNSAVIKQEIKQKIENHANDDDLVSPAVSPDQNNPQF